MSPPVDVAWVTLWGQTVGAVAWDPDQGLAAFEFEPAFLSSGLDPSPIMMPVAQPGRVHRFPGLGRDAFRGLPGMLADSLPDRFGHRVIDAWLARQGRSPGDFSPVERLCYMGSRGMGALEFEPGISTGLDEGVPVQVVELAQLAAMVQAERQELQHQLPDEGAGRDALLDLLRVGTSAGGARPKAVLAWNRATGEMRSGQVPNPEGFEHWLLKFDGVSDPGLEGRATLGEGAGFGRIEFAYHLMAREAGIQMAHCHLLEEGGRAHFMTRRFDRTDDGSKLHLQSLCALAHLDFNEAGAHSQEQAFQVMRMLRLSYPEMAEHFRRVVFNVLTRNQDDHTKNIAFLMERDGAWQLAPAFDLTFAFNPSGQWTRSHQMTIGGKRDGFTRLDLLALAQAMDVPDPADILSEVAAAVARWEEFAKAAGMATTTTTAIGKLHRRL